MLRSPGLLLTKQAAVMTTKRPLGSNVCQRGRWEACKHFCNTFSMVKPLGSINTKFVAEVVVLFVVLLVLAGVVFHHGAA